MLLCWVSFLISLGFGAILGVLPYYMLYLVGELTELPEELGRIGTAGGYALEYGALMSAFMLTRALLARYFGSLSDRVGRKRLIIVGTAMYVFLSFAYILSTTLTQLYLIRGLQGVASAMVWPVAEALLMDSTEQEFRARAMALYMISTNVAWILGPAIGVAAYKIGVRYLRISDVGAALRFPFLFLTVFSAAGLPATFLLSERRLPSPKTRKEDSRVDVDMHRTVRRSLNAIYVMALANGFAMGFSGPLMGLFVVQFISSDPAALAIVTTVSGAIGLAAAYPAGKLADAFGRRPIIIAGGLASRLMTALMPFSSDVEGLTALATVRSIAFNSSQPAMRALQADLVPESVRGRIFGTVQAMFNVGAVVGPLLGGQLYGHFHEVTLSLGPISAPGVALSFWVGALIGIFSIIVFAAFVEEPRAPPSRLNSAELLDAG